jgi:hypothetical protein
MPKQSSPQDTALDHLRVIRTLMERASIYRAVSAPAALVGGLMALAVAAYGFQHNYFTKDMKVISNSFRSNEFLRAWLTVLAISSMINLYLLNRESRRKGKPFLTEGFLTALRGIVPPMLTGGVLGICLIHYGNQLELGALVWILCYGLALQTTVSFAPPSIIMLARAFIITGQALTIFWFVSGGLGMFQRSEAPASLFLGVTFGLFHVIYAIAVFMSKPKTGITEK